MSFYYVSLINYYIKLKKLKKCLIFLILITFLFFSKKVKLNEKFYITLTSWKGRINFIHKNIENLLNNTIKAKKVILNLAQEEFPSKNLELPKEILSLLKKYNNFEIFWVKENNNVFKKLIPTLNRFKKDIIISLDDDIFYPNNTIENMLKCYNKSGKKNPISFGTKYSDWNINGKVINAHFGAGSLVKYEFFNNKINEIYLNTTVDRIKKGIKCADDALYTYAALVNGYKYIRCKDYCIDLNLYIKPSLKAAFSENNSRNFSILLKDYHNIIRKYIMNKYNITIVNLIKKIEKNELTKI